jgi:cytochrome P450
MSAALRALVARMPNLRLAVPATEVPRRLGLGMLGPRSLPVSW